MPRFDQGGSSFYLTMKGVVFVVLVCTLNLLVEGKKSCKTNQIRTLKKCLVKGYESTLANCAANPGKSMTKKQRRPCNKAQKKLLKCGYECEAPPTPAPKPDPHCKNIRFSTEYAVIKVEKHQEAGKATKLRLVWGNPAEEGDEDDHSKKSGEVSWNIANGAGSGYMSFPDIMKFELKYYPDEPSGEGEEPSGHVWEGKICEADS